MERERKPQEVHDAIVYLIQQGRDPREVDQQTIREIHDALRTQPALVFFPEQNPENILTVPGDDPRSTLFDRFVESSKIHPDNWESNPLARSVHAALFGNGNSSNGNGIDFKNTEGSLCSVQSVHDKNEDQL